MKINTYCNFGFGGHFDLFSIYFALAHTRNQFNVSKIYYFKVGIEECLHIEFEYNKSKYHLKDVIVGKIYFLLVRSAGTIFLWRLLNFSCSRFGSRSSTWK